MSTDCQSESATRRWIVRTHGKHSVHRLPVLQVGAISVDNDAREVVLCKIRSVHHEIWGQFHEFVSTIDTEVTMELFGQWGTYIGLSAAACTRTKTSPFSSLVDTGASFLSSSARSGLPRRTTTHAFCVAGIWAVSEVVDMICEGKRDSRHRSLHHSCRLYTADG